MNQSNFVKGLRYHEECPDGVVEENGGCEDEHCESDETIELRQSVFLICLARLREYVRNCWQPLLC